MKYNIILAGVGGQGVLSLSMIISMGALKQGFHVRQSEVHGMAQRGGAVQAHLRISDKKIESDLVPLNSADIIISMEPLEALRDLDYLSDSGVLVTSLDPEMNIPDYPEKDILLKKIESLSNYKIVDAKKIAENAGSVRAVNMVLVGAASKRLPVTEVNLISAIREKFKLKKAKVLDINIKAFELGRDA